jgi:hypothetical protein
LRKSALRNALKWRAEVIVTGQEIGHILGDTPVLQTEHFSLGIIASVFVYCNRLLVDQPDRRLRIGNASFRIAIDDGAIVVDYGGGL